MCEVEREDGRDASEIWDEEQAMGLQFTPEVFEAIRRLCEK